MYENYTRQALPSKKYRELLGSALCVFNANNAFVIENIFVSDFWVIVFLIGVDNLPDSKSIKSYQLY